MVFLVFSLVVEVVYVGCVLGVWGGCLGFVFIEVSGGDTFCLGSFGLIVLTGWG